MGEEETPRILVVEDDRDFAPVLKRLLKKKLAAEVVVAEDCARARDALASSSFDLITLDYQLPDGDGLDLLEEIKPQIGLTPVIMVTGHGDETTAMRAFRAGASGYVVKDGRLSSMLPSTLEQALDHRLTEESLRASEARFRRLFEAAKDGILILDAETGRITDVNPFLKELLGYTREEMLGASLWEIGPFKDIAESKELFRELQQRAYVRYEHLPIQAKDGRSVDVEFVSNVYRVDHTKVIQCNIRDITERKRAQDKSEEHYLTLRGIIESTDSPIFSVDTNYRYTSFNRAHAAVMKSLYGADIKLGESLLEYQTVEEDRAGAKRNIDRALDGERVIEVAYSGEEVRSRLHFEVLHNPIWGGDGRIVGVAIFAKDVTEQKRAAEALRQSEETLQTIFDAVPGLLFFKDKNNKLVRANRALCDTLGLSEEEIIGKPLSELFPNQSEQYWQDDLDVIESGNPKLGILEPMETPRGTLWFQTDKLPYRNTEADIIGVIGFSLDITERQRYEEELKQVNAELEGYAHTVSHDLKGPLASMGMSLSMLRELLESPKSKEAGLEVLEVVDLMGLSLERADQLIGTLLKLAEAGQVPGEVTSIDVGQMVKRVLEERAREIKVRGIKVEVDSDLGHVVADYSHVYQLFANLIANAIQHNDSESPVIEVSRLGEEGEGGHRYLVRDNGSGIPPETIDRIFMPFFKGKTGGSGIGLSTVKKIVKLYGGEISAYNDSGACFEFTLGDCKP
jgi:PAS domain S-box-containing protein